MSEESHKRKHNRNRLIMWVGVAATILGISFTPSPLPKPDYVPTIVNGLVTSMSVLMAFTFFHLSQTNANIQDKVERAKFHLRASYYLSVLFGIMLLGVLFGYRLVLDNDLGHAFTWFMSMFLIMFGIVGDLWTEIG